MLNSLEFTDIVEASDGLEALDHLKTEHFDLVFMDLQMPNLDGLGCLNEYKKIKTSIDSKENPIFIAQTLKEEGKEDSLLSAGFHELFFKPYNKESLENLLKKYSDKKL